MDKSLMPKTKHNHKWTDILKVCIFSILMIAPFIAILSKIIYVSANKNAKDSYYGETINEERIESIELQDLVVGETYNYITSSTLTYEYQSEVRFNVANCEMIYPTNSHDYEVNKIIIRSQNNGTYIFFYKDQTYITDRNLATTTVNFKFTYVDGLFGTLIDNYEYFYGTTYNKYSYLDNVFYYAVDQMKNDQLFKWVDTTIVYNGLNAMNTGFGLPSNHVITYLLAYWTILTAIYIIIDIILFLFTKLTHLLQ